MTLGRHRRAGLQFASVLGSSVALAAMLSLGCDESTHVPSAIPVADQRGAVSPQASPGVGPATELPMPGQRDPNQARRAPAPRQVIPPTAPAAPAPGPAAVARTTEEAAPDYASTLRSAFGTPTSCISASTRERLQGALTLNVTVRVSPSGRVTSATVSGAGLASGDVACMTERAEGLRLGPIEDAPRSVRATITFDIASTAGTRSDSETPEWQNRPGAQAPGTTLPAGGTAARPTGFVPPSSTLPATQ